MRTLNKRAVRCRHVYVRQRLNCRKMQAKQGRGRKKLMPKNWLMRPTPLPHPVTGSAAEWARCCNRSSDYVPRGLRTIIARSPSTSLSRCGSRFFFFFFFPQQRPRQVRLDDDDAAPTSSYGCKCGRMDTMQQSLQRLDVPAAHASSLWKCVQRGEHVAAVVASKTTTPLMKERELFFSCVDA